MQIVLVLEDAEVFERIALHGDEVGELARLDGADLILHAEDLGVHLRGREQDLHRLHHLALQLELHRALRLHVTEEIGARADLAPRAVGVGQALPGELARHIDLVQLMLGDAVALALAPDRLVGDHGGHQIDPRLLDLLGSRRVDQVAVLDAAHARLNGRAYRGARVGVGQHVFPHRARLFDGRAHLLHGVLGGVELVGGRHGPARGHDLDLVHVAPELLPGSLAHLVGAVRDDAHHAQAAVDGVDQLGAPPLVAMSSRLREHTSGDEHARPRVHAGPDRFAEAVVGAPRVPHRGESLQKRLLDAPERLGRDEAGRIVAVLLGGVALHRAHVHMGVGETGHEGAAPEVEGLDLAPQGADLARANDVLDALAFHHHGGAVDGLLARPVDQERVGQDDEGHARLLTASRAWLRTSTPFRRRGAASRSSWPRRRDRAAARERPTAPRWPPSAGSPPTPPAASSGPRWRWRWRSCPRAPCCPRTRNRSWSPGTAARW